jgi:adenylate cyclase, class 2
MGHEVEIKLRVVDMNALQDRITKIGARPAFGKVGRVHEENVLFDTASQTLKRRRELLRIRTETPENEGSNRNIRKRVLLTYKRPIRTGRNTASGSRGRHKVLEEIEFEVSNSAALTDVLQGLGFRPWFRYEKFRTTFRLGKSRKWAAGLLIELDETPIGAFVELEGPGLAIDRAARELGFTRKDYVMSNYFSLYRTDCRQRGKMVRDMAFPKRRTQVKNG